MRAPLFPTFSFNTQPQNKKGTRVLLGFINPIHYHILWLLGFRVYSLGYRVSGLGFKALSSGLSLYTWAGDPFQEPQGPTLVHMRVCEKF